MDFIDPTMTKTKDYVRRVWNKNQKERVAPYHPSIDKKLAKLFETTLPLEQNKPAPRLWIGAFSIRMMVNPANCLIGQSGKSNGLNGSKTKMKHCRK